MKDRALILVLWLGMTLHPFNVGKQLFGPAESQPHLFAQVKFTSAWLLPPCLATPNTQNSPLTAYLCARPPGPCFIHLCAVCTCPGT